MTLPSGSQHRRELDLPGSADCTAEFVMAPNLSGTVRAVLISGPSLVRVSWPRGDLKVKPIQRAARPIGELHHEHVVIQGLGNRA